MLEAMSRWATVAMAAAVAAIVAAGGDARAQPACVPVVRVTGEPTLSAPVKQLLSRRGVRVSGESRCGTLTAVLTGRGEQTRITIVDAEGRAVERTAADAEAAATIIESWTRGDLSAPLLAARDAPPRARQALDREAPPPIEETAAIDTRPIELGVTAGAGLSSDRALWTAAHAHACVTVGPVCAGALVRVSSDTESQGDSVERGTSRSALDLLLVADLPLRRGRLGLTPGIGIGQTSLRARRGSGERERVTTTGLHLRARVGASVRVVGAWSLQADLALGASPFARKLLQEEQFGADDPADPDDALPMSGVPRLHGWFGVGLLYGGL
jgi:hypothetical protein